MKNYLCCKIVELDVDRRGLGLNSMLFQQTEVVIVCTEQARVAALVARQLCF